jgi:UTP--glucose-1-phosphate uridylyltransferase
MKIRKAVITAAGKTQRGLPLQTLVDRDGIQKSALRIILQEAISSGVEEVCAIINCGDQRLYSEAAGELAGRLQFVEQTEPLGYAHALHCAKAFVGGDPFLHLVSDHLYLSKSGARCAQQLVQIAETHNCSVSAVQATRESMLTFYGTVGGRRVAGQNSLYQVENVVEKPTPTEAEQTLLVPGLRSGHYLCFFGIHVLTPAIMDLLGGLLARAKPNERLSISPALAELARKERYLALELQGSRYNIGVRYGLLTAQLALALDGHDRDEVLAQLVELLATRDKSA